MNNSFGPRPSHSCSVLQSFFVLKEKGERIRKLKVKPVCLVVFLILSFYMGGVINQNSMKKVVGFKNRWMVLVGMVFLFPILDGC